MSDETDRRFFMPGWEATQQAMGFSQAVRRGNLLHISGTVSVDEDFAPLHAGDMAAQIRQVYDSLGKTLQAFGAGFPDVVREVMYVTDMDALVAAVEARRSYYGDGPFPASTAVEVRRLLFPELLIEVQVDAYLAA